MTRALKFDNDTPLERSTAPILPREISVPRRVEFTRTGTRCVRHLAGANPRMALTRVRGDRTSKRQLDFWSALLSFPVRAALKSFSKSLQAPRGVARAT